VPQFKNTHGLMVATDSESTQLQDDNSDTERIERMSDLRRSPKSDGIEVQFEAIVTQPTQAKPRSRTQVRIKTGSLRSL